jgi:hypothetical protein
MLYLNGEIDAGVIGRLADAGGTQVAARNPAGTGGCHDRGPGWVPAGPDQPLLALVGPQHLTGARACRR